MVEVNVLNSQGKGCLQAPRLQGWLLGQLSVPRAQREIKAGAFCSGVNLSLDFSRTCKTFARVTIKKGVKCLAHNYLF